MKLRAAPGHPGRSPGQHFRGPNLGHSISCSDSGSGHSLRWLCSASAAVLSSPSRPQLGPGPQGLPLVFRGHWSLPRSGLCCFTHDFLLGGPVCHCHWAFGNMFSSSSSPTAWWKYSASSFSSCCPATSALLSPSTSCLLGSSSCGPLAVPAYAGYSGPAGPASEP